MFSRILLLCLLLACIVFAADVDDSKTELCRPDRSFEQLADIMGVFLNKTTKSLDILSNYIEDGQLTVEKLGQKIKKQQEFFREETDAFIAQLRELRSLDAYLTQIPKYNKQTNVILDKINAKKAINDDEIITKIFLRIQFLQYTTEVNEIFANLSSNHYMYQLKMIDKHNFFKQAEESRTIVSNSKDVIMALKPRVDLIKWDFKLKQAKKNLQ